MPAQSPAKSAAQYEQTAVALSHDCDFALFFKKYGDTYKIFRNVRGARPQVVKVTKSPALLVQVMCRESRLAMSPRKNPAPREESAARDLAERFHGRAVDPDEYEKIPMPKCPKVMARIGDIFAIEYLAERDGKEYRFRHVFKSKCRPALAVSPDGTIVSLLGGAWKFGEDGFEDVA